MIKVTLLLALTCVAVSCHNNISKERDQEPPQKLCGQPKDIGVRIKEVNSIGPPMGTFAADWKNLHLKYDLLLNGYFTIPLTLDELLKDNWVYMTKDSDLNVDFYSYGADPRVSIGYDVNGNIAAVRTAYIISDLTNRATTNGLTFPYTFTDKPIFSKGTFLNKDVYYTTVLFASPATLAAGGRTDTGGLLAENAYVKINGEYTVMPKKEADATALGFVKQGCFVGMGQHYFLGLSNTTECNSFQGVFLLYNGGELIGIGLIPFGSFTSGDRTWFEDPPLLAVKAIAPHRPTCLTKWVTNYGATALHLFFNKFPRLTTC